MLPDHSYLLRSNRALIKLERVHSQSSKLCSFISLSFVPEYGKVILSLSFVECTYKQQNKLAYCSFSLNKNHLDLHSQLVIAYWKENELQKRWLPFPAPWYSTQTWNEDDFSALF